MAINIWVFRVPNSFGEGVFGTTVDGTIKISFSAINGSEVWVAGIGVWRASVNSNRTRTSDRAWRTQSVHVRHTTSYAFVYTIYVCYNIIVASSYMAESESFLLSRQSRVFFVVVNLTYTIFLFISSSVSLFRLRCRHTGRVRVRWRSRGYEENKKCAIKFINTPRGDGKKRMNEWTEPSRATTLYIYAKKAIEKSCRTLAHTIVVCFSMTRF